MFKQSMTTFGILGLSRYSPTIGKASSTYQEERWFRYDQRRLEGNP